MRTVFTEASTRRIVSPWGAEVKKKLIDFRMQQDELVKALRVRGFQIDKSALSNLLYGIGTSNRQGEIKAINEMLKIPYRSEAESLMVQSQGGILLKKKKNRSSFTGV